MTSKRRQPNSGNKFLSRWDQLRRQEELYQRVLSEPWPERQGDVEEAMKLFFTNPKKLREWRRKTIAGIRRYSKRDRTVPSSWASRTIAGIDAFYRKLMRELTRTRKELIRP